jgi:hypothetical protein
MKAINSEVFLPRLTVEVCLPCLFSSSSTHIASPSYLPSLPFLPFPFLITLMQMIEGSHWVHMENYLPANKAIRDWLENVWAKATPEKKAGEETIHNKDEL